MKEIFSLVWKRTIESLKKLTIFAGVLDTIFIASYIYAYGGIGELLFFIELIVFAFTMFFIITFVFIFILILLAESSKRKNTLAVSILGILILFYVLVIARGFIGMILELYSDNLGIDKGTFVSSIIALLSLMVAVGMPLYLTENNRRRAEKVAIKNQKHNEEMILENRKHSEDMMLNEMRMSAVPILSYSVSGITGINKNNEKKSLDRFLYVNIKNVSDRIATSLLYRNDRIHGIDGRILFDGEIVKHELIKKPFLLGDEKSFKVNVSDIVNIMSENETKYQPLTIYMYFADIYNNEYFEKIFIGIKREEQDRFEAIFHYTSKKELAKYN